jgi:hypothetical protein
MSYYDSGNRHKNFSFPITTTNDGGIHSDSLVEEHSKPSGIEQLNRLGAEIKSGHVQLEEHNFSLGI